MHKLAMVRILNTELICDYPIFYKFIQVRENQEDQAVSLATEA